MEIEEKTRHQTRNRKDEAITPGGKNWSIAYPEASGNGGSWVALVAKKICFTPIKSSTPHTFSKLAGLILDGTLKPIKLLLAALLEVTARIRKRS